MAREGDGFLDASEGEFDLDEGGMGGLGGVDVGAVFGDGEVFGALAREAGDLAGEGEFDGVDDAAFAGAVGAGDGERFAALEGEVEFADAAQLFDMEGFEFQHCGAAPAGARIWRRSSVLSGRSLRRRFWSWVS